MADTSSRLGFVALVAAQALGAFSHNLLRSALLTLVAFGPLDTAGLGRETTIALATLFVVAPYAFLSIPAGRLADRFPKVAILRAVKAFEIAVFSLAALGLWAMSVPVLLISVMLAGISAAVFGPAKFGILPELLPRERLVRGNSWVGATGTLAILAGLIAGNLLAPSGAGLTIVAASGIGLAVFGLLISYGIPWTASRAPGLALTAPSFAADFWKCFARLVQFPALVVPLAGCSWFWFQGVANTSLIPLYVAQAPSLPESTVSVLLIASTVGTILGAVAARWLEGRSTARLLPFITFLIIALPGIDLWLIGPMADASTILRATVDFFLLAAGCGLYLVPLTVAVQQLTPDEERARFVGLNHTVNGIAMMAAGLVVLLLNLPWIGAELLFGVVAVTSGIVGALALRFIMPMLASSPMTPTPSRT